MEKATILVVEDEAITAMNLQLQLQHMGYDVPDTVAKGEDAIDKAREIRPDLLLMDIALAGQIDGIEAARQIRLTNDIPVIYLSAYTDNMLSERAKDTEPFGYLSKPITDSDLFNTIEMALYKHSVEKVLKKSEEKYRLLFNNLINPITVYDLNGNILVINIAGAKNLGRSPEELQEKSLYEIIPEAKDIIVRRIHKVVKSKQGIDNIEDLIKLPSGEERWFLSNHQPLKDDSGKIYAVQVISYDITERKMAEEKTIKVAKEWEATFDSISDMVSIHDKDFNLVRVNKAFCNLLKKKREEIIGKKCYEVLHERNEPWPECPHKQTMKVKEPFTEEFFEPKLGIYLQVSTSPIFDENREIIGTVHIAKDITDRKKTEKRINKSLEEK